MTDNKLRCVLAFRLGDAEAGGAIALAKYDHASQYETHAGASGDAGTLYGSRDKSYSDAVGMVVGSDPPVPTSETIGGFKVVQSEMHQVVYGADQNSLCLAVITGLKYPSRVAIQMLVELHHQFTSELGSSVASAKANSLNGKAKKMFTAACKKYDDLSQVDKTSNLIGKVDEVKVQMQSNIADMLKNTEKAENLAERSDALNEQANVFKKKSREVRNQMWYKNVKTTAMLVGLIVIILIVILVPVIKNLKKDK